MQRWVALLRGINVGRGHRVNMAVLRELFGALGFANIATYIASGNVIFETSEQNRTVLREQIELQLHTALGYAVPTSIRTATELGAVARYQPFPAPRFPTSGATLAVLFGCQPLPDHSAEVLRGYESPVDMFHIHGEEIYWLTAGKMSDSPVDFPRLYRRLGVPTTTRAVSSVRKMAALYAPSEE